MPVPVFDQLPHSRGNGHMAAASSRETSMPVLAGRVAVQAYPNLDANLVEQRQISVIEADPVGLDARMYRGIITDSVPHRSHQMGDEFRSGQQWLTAMQDESDLMQAVSVDVLADPGGGLVGNCQRHPLRSRPPGLIGHLVHVAVIAGKITPTVDLQYEFPERRRPPTVRHERADIECGWPLGRSLYGHSRLNHTRPSIIGTVLVPTRSSITSIATALVANPCVLG